MSAYRNRDNKNKQPKPKQDGKIATTTSPGGKPTTQGGDKQTKGSIKPGAKGGAPGKTSKKEKLV